MIHIHDETSNQTFFANATQFRKNCEDIFVLRDQELDEGMRLKSDGWVDCISLETPPVLVSVDGPSLLSKQKGSGSAL